MRVRGVFLYMKRAIEIDVFTYTFLTVSLHRALFATTDRQDKLNYNTVFTDQ